MKKRTLPWDILVAALLVAAGLLILICLAGFRPSAYCCFGGAAVLLGYRLLWLIGKKHPKTGRVLTMVATILLLLLLVAAIITGVFIAGGAKGEADTPVDYLIVLGAGVNGTTPSMSLAERIDSAYDYLSAHPDVICIASGGKGKGERISEASCIYRELTARGIDGSRIWQEDRSTSTRENLINSLALIEEKTGARPARAGVLSSAYHLFRADKMAAKLGLDMVGIPAESRWFALYCNYFLREIVAVWYYMIFGG